jgi:hypothetical protein
MAKISARGATEVSRVHGTTEYGGATLVLTSDGRVLRKFDGERGYGLLGRISDKAKRTPEMLAAVLVRFGYTPDPERRAS